MDVSLLLLPGSGRVQGKFSGWVFYDANCALCVRLARRAEGLLLRKGLVLVPLQTKGVSAWLGLSEAELLQEMRVLTADGRLLGGADGVLEVFRDVRWAWPLLLLARLPGGLALLRWGYARLAANRYCISGACSFPPNRVEKVPAKPSRSAVHEAHGPHAVHRRKLSLSPIGWLPLVLLSLAAFTTRPVLPAWVFMWVLAVALWAGCKWLTLYQAYLDGHSFSRGRAAGYLLGWVGMDAVAFSSDSGRQGKESARVLRPWREAGEAGGVTLLGVVLLWFLARRFVELPLLAGWIGMFGMILALHFGTFRLLALLWRQVGFPVSPLMRQPWRSSSVGEFWGGRWNTSFHTLVHRFLFRPAKTWHARWTQKTSAAAAAAGSAKIWATLLVFFVSGLIHDLVISVPAGGGYGLPTAYFLFQGFALLLERSGVGRTLGLGQGWRGRVYTLSVTAGPAFWLFPPVFVHQVILPMWKAIGAI